MDGVLVLSSEIHRKAFQDVLQPYRLKYQYERIAGYTTGAALKRIFGENGLSIEPTELERLQQTKSRLALTRIAEERPIAPAAAIVLPQLKERYRLGLATSASAATVSWFLEASGVGHLFETVVTSNTGTASKPAPDLFLAAMGNLGVHPERCLVVEDSVAGIGAAKAAGAIACGIPGTSPGWELEQAGADLIISSLDELLTL